MNTSSGRTRQAFDRLSEKVLKNIETFCVKMDATFASKELHPFFYW